MERIRGIRWRKAWLFVACTWTCVWISAPSVQAQPTAASLLESYRPRQSDVEYDIPPKADWGKCRVEVEKTSNTHGYVVLGTEGQVLRRFIDTDDTDDQVDQFRYYLHGIEVYREIDTNGNNKIDQYRWLNFGGTRWGIDHNEDGRIDEWKVLSAQEASREAIRAMISGDMLALQLVLVNQDDLQRLGVHPAIQTKMLESVANAAAKVQNIVKRSTVLTSRARWVRFDANMPGIIPAEDGKAREDLWVYENAIALVEVSASTRPTTPAATHVIQLGELVKVGDVWKLTQVPQPVEGENFVTTGGFLIQPLATPAETVALSPEVQKLIEELQQLDQKAPQLGQASPAELSAYYRQRTRILKQLAETVAVHEEKAAFIKQCVDSLAAAVQTDVYPEGIKEIEAFERQASQGGASTSLLPYIVYRRIMSQYTLQMKEASLEQRGEVQQKWLEQLAKYVDSYPQAEDAPDAMWQLATAYEFSGKNEEAVRWYQRLMGQKQDTLIANKAAGAIRRLNLKGKPLVLTGTTLDGQSVNTAQLKGRVVLILYWATWSELFKQEIPQLRALYQQYQPKGLEIVGISLDIFPGNRLQQAAEIRNYVRQTNIPGIQIFEPGGLDSPLAVQLGIISVPTLILIDQRGEVVSRNVSTIELKDLLPKLFSR